MRLRKPWIETNRTVTPHTHTVRWNLEFGLDGKRKTDRFFCGSDKQYALQMKEVIAKRLKKQAAGLVDDERPIVDCMKAFLKDEEKRVSSKRHTNYRHSLYSYRTLCGFETMNQVTGASILNYQSYLREKNKSNWTIIIYVGCVGAWLKWALAREWIAKNPYPKIKFDPPRQVDRFYTNDEIAKFEEVIDNEEFRLMFRLGYMAGLRPGEVLRVRGCDAFFAEPDGWMLRIAPDQVKTNSGRNVELPPEIMALWPKSPGLVFEHWTEQRRDRHFEKAKVRAKIEDRIIPSRSKGVPPQVIPKTFYWTRHTYARRQIERGMHMRVLSILMGHASFRLTADTYGHLDNKSVMEHLLNLPRQTVPQIINGAQTGQQGVIVDVSGDSVTSQDTTNDNDD